MFAGHQGAVSKKCFNCSLPTHPLATMPYNISVKVAAAGRRTFRKRAALYLKHQIAYDEANTSLSNITHLRGRSADCSNTSEGAK